MIFDFFRYIYWNFHVSLRSFTADSEVADTMGSASLFGSGTLFWLLSIYKVSAGFIIDGNPLMNVLYVGAVFVLAIAFAIVVVVTTKESVDGGYVRIGVLNKSLSKIVSLLYVVGSFITFFGFIL